MSTDDDRPDAEKIDRPKSVALELGSEPERGIGQPKSSAVSVGEGGADTESAPIDLPAEQANP